MEERKRYIKVGAVVFNSNAGFGQDSFPDIKAKVLGVVGPSARIQVEDNMVLSVLPVFKLINPGIRFVNRNNKIFVFFFMGLVSSQMNCALTI